MSLSKKVSPIVAIDIVDICSSQAYMENGLNCWQERNTRLTKESCHQLLLGLKRQHLDPVLTQLRGQDGAQMSFAEIMACYSSIEQGFKSEAIGAEDVCAQVFLDFHPVSKYIRRSLFTSIFYYT